MSKVYRSRVANRDVIKRQVGSGLVWVWVSGFSTLPRRVGFSHASRGGGLVLRGQANRSTRNGVYFRVGYVRVMVCWRRVSRLLVQEPRKRESVQSRY